MARPNVYFATMDTEELLRYASQYAETELEKALAKALEVSIESTFTQEAVYSLTDEIQSVANCVNEIPKYRIAELLYEAVDTLNKSKG